MVIWLDAHNQLQHLSVVKDKERTPKPHKVKLVHCDDRLPIYIGYIYEMAYVAA